MLNNRQLIQNFFLLILLMTFSGLVAVDTNDELYLSLWDASDDLQAKGYSKPNGASQESWEAVQPHLLPYFHPAKKALDGIFANGRPLLSPKHMKKAGFLNYTPSDKGIIVSAHPRLRGYLIKAYLDTCYLPDWKLWIQRIVGANQLRQSILDFGYSSIMKAPKKWIYPLPPNSSPPEGEGYFPKHYILVVQNMGILSPGGNEENWHSQVKHPLLNAFYTFVMTNGLVDSYFIDNSPFCFDRKIAFLDTEHYNVDIRQFPGRQNILLNYLSPTMGSYWEHLLLNGVPQ